MRFYNFVDKNLTAVGQKSGYCITKVVSRSILFPYKSFNPNRDIFYDKIVLNFFLTCRKIFLPEDCDDVHEKISTISSYKISTRY